MLNLNSSHRLALWALTVILLAPTTLYADERATPEQAQALVAKAIALYDDAGREATFVAIEDPNGEFIDHDLYIFVFGPNRTIVAHGGDKDLFGTPADTLKDIDGVPFGTMFMDEATASGHWVNYKWVDPVTRAVHPKTSWVVRHDGYIFGAGVYQP